MGVMRKVVVITGMQAAGKSTIGPLLAARLGPPAASFDGDVFYRMVAAGKVDMTPDPEPEALRQLNLRYDASALVARHYLKAGFDFVYADIILGDDLTRWLESIQDAERHLVVLNPSTEVIVERELGRGSNAYRDWQKPGMTLAAGVASLQEALTETPKRGLWLDTSEQTPEETVAQIFADDLQASLY
jgi:chloramphenicol 3-O-phosphotransferase